VEFRSHIDKPLNDVDTEKENFVLTDSLENRLFFSVSGIEYELHNQDKFLFISISDHHTDFYSHLKSKVDNILVTSLRINLDIDDQDICLRINLDIDDDPIVSHTHILQTCRLLVTSLSFGIPD
jgi:hypothetical protein